MAYTDFQLLIEKMSIDYGSTARALSLPVGADRRSSPTSFRPPWIRGQSYSNGGRRSSFSNHQSNSLRNKVIREARKLLRHAVEFNERMTTLQLGLLSAFLVLGSVLMILFFVYNEKIFGALKPFAVSWKNATGGWTILWTLTFLTAFPPVVGYSTCATLAGFVYGVGEGWLILSSATVIGSTCSFLVSRFILRKYVERLVANDKRFAALTLTLKSDGLKLLCMIRLCPLPYSLSNGGISTFPTVHPMMYALATAIVSPKLLIPVFIGSRLSAIGEHGGQMSAGAKFVNWISILATGLLGLFTGWYIYQRTMTRARQLEAEEQTNVQQSAAGTRETPAQFLDDPEAFAVANALVGEDEEEEEEEEEDIAFFDDEQREESRRSDKDRLMATDDIFSRFEENEDALNLQRHQSK